MTQEEKELLLKDLCARLAYGFIVHRYSDNCDISFKRNELDQFAHFLEYSEDEIFKPYLRSISSMTREEEKEFVQFHCTKLCPIVINDCLTIDNEGKMIDWLNSHHFDYRGLIGKGLALEAPKDMYKTE